MSATLYKAYELEDAICEILSTDTDFLAFCTNLISEECKVIGGEDPQSADPKEDYPCIVVNVEKQTGDEAKEKGVDRSIEISILLNVSKERVPVGNYFKYADTPKAEEIASEIYKIINENYCEDVSPYYYEKNVNLIAQGYLMGSLEMVASVATYLGGRTW